MAKILVSVVVPIYNAQTTLVRCVNSIINQTFAKHMEIILVDDGSTDDSGLLCDSFAETADNVRVIHQPNAGMGAAYNAGIAAARGEYIGLVESDDFIEPNMYEVMYNNAKENDSDLVKCGLLNWHPADNQNYIPGWEDEILKEITRENRAFTLLEYKKLLTYHSSVWATLYRSDFVKQIMFSTDPDASYQDLFFMIQCLVRAKRISAVYGYFYHWNRNNPNASVLRNDEKLMRILDQSIMAKNFLIEQGCFDELFSEFYKQITYINLIFFNQIRNDLKPVFWGRLREFFSDINLKNLSRATKLFSEHEIRFMVDLISEI